ncbi:hypothetical protein [Micromonospora sp. URMC 103]
MLEMITGTAETAEVAVAHPIARLVFWLDLLSGRRDHRIGIPITL